MASSEKEGSQGEHKENETNGVAAMGFKQTLRRKEGPGFIKTRNWEDLQAAKAMLELHSTLGDFKTTTLKRETEVRLKIVSARGIHLNEKNAVLTYDEIRDANILMEMYANNINSKKIVSEVKMDSDAENFNPAAVTGTFRTGSFEISPEQSVRLKKKLRWRVKRSVLKTLKPKEVNQRFKMTSRENSERIKKTSHPLETRNKATGFSSMKEWLREGLDQTVSVESLQDKLKDPADNEQKM